MLQIAAFEERRNRDRCIGQHKEREGEKVFNHLILRAVDNLPFGDKSDKANDEDKHINYRTEIEQRYHTELQEHR